MRKTEGELGMFHLVLGFCVILFAAILGVVQLINNEADALPEPVNLIELSEQMCVSSGGQWNSCSSACRGEEEGACIQVCVEVCECTSNDTCPFGFACINIIDGIGICAR
ncbi:MAG: hypothetical protein O3B64_02010 [bacterium]|nr:hypothetical protein [bacterium]MDA1024661.1 hypothetical protein [bacterium]